MEPNAFLKYPKRGTASVLSNFGHGQYLSNNVNPWCLITEYPNEGIGFLINFSKVMQYPSKFENICYGTQCIHGILYTWYCMRIE